MSIIRCPHCGTANREGSNFCNGCGTDLRSPDTPSETTPAPVTPPTPAETPPAPPGRARPRRPRLARPAVPPSEPPASPPAASSSGEAPFADQPWLGLEFDAGDTPEEAGADDKNLSDPEEEPRLVTGLQGLLTPIRIATNIGDQDPSPPASAPLLPTTDLNAEQIRLIRTLMAEELAPLPSLGRPYRPAALHVGWVFLLLAAAVGLPALLLFGGPFGRAMTWSGVEEAHTAVQALGPEALVIVYWAYDPATADEVNLAMRPVMRHLLDRRVRLAVVSTLPGGPATARRLIAQAMTGVERPSALAVAAETNWPVTYSYLPGGVSVLALAARDPVAALLEDPAAVTPATLAAVERTPELVVVAAAQAEEAQAWLEQVQPLADTPTIAVTGAGADPILRPYLDSGQLRGLVSGFDGGYSYQQLMEPFTAHTSPDWLFPQVVLQNWGHLAFIVIIVLGNLAALLGRAGGE